MTTQDKIQQVLSGVTTEELLDELKRRRMEALRTCSDDEIENELSKRTGYDGPKIVEK